METEKMKAKAGKLYDANYDAELLKEREICADMTFAFNQLRPSQTKERMEILRKLFGKTKESFYDCVAFFLRLWLQYRNRRKLFHEYGLRYS